jgi:hypothetical protein
VPFSRPFYTTWQLVGGRTAYENADGVIAVSEAMRRDVHALYDVPLGSSIWRPWRVRRP